MTKTLTLPNFQAQSKLIQFMVALSATALLTLSAKIQIPMYPVNTTLQPLMLLLIGATFGPRLALMTVGMYLMEGAMNLPVFTSTPDRGIGLSYMAGPTGGYLVGFLSTVAIAGYLAQKGWTNSFLKACGLGVISFASLYGFGYAYLAVLIGIDAAWHGGVVVFMPSAVLSIGFATAILSATHNLRGSN
jgi:biotin transport system substrate-specific component